MTGGEMRTKYKPKIAKLKIELMAIVLTNIKRPSKSEMTATKQIARNGVLFFGEHTKEA
jgi:hypothetical protein